jgi:menaquinol-cytochrome c reductase iron-sulfur subunit
MDPNQPIAQEQPVDEATRIRQAGHSRRAFLFKLSLALNGIVGAVMAVPIIG